jgi:hypothetical protein
MTLTIEPYKRKAKKVRAKQRIKPKVKRLTLKKADILFSHQIRARDKFCQFPNCMVSDPAKLQNSHYFGRAIKSTRFDPDNCVALCWLHHFKDKLLGYEYQKQTYEKHGYDGQYTKFMKARLGEKKFRFLREKSRRTMKQNIAIDLFEQSLITLER